MDGTDWTDGRAGRMDGRDGRKAVLSYQSLDDQTLVQYLPDLAAAVEDADLVVGSRYLNGISVVNWELSRLILSKFANAYVRTITGLPFQDSTAGFQCITRRALEAIDLGAIRTDGYSFLVELKYRIYRAGMRGREVPIVFTQRRAGASKISKTEVIRSMLTPWKMRLGLWTHREQS